MQYPASCPYVTTVGATRLWSNDTVHSPESSMILPGYGYDGTQFSTAGGFSNYFSRPNWQDAAIDEYFAQHDPGYPYYTFDGNFASIGANGGVYNRAGTFAEDNRATVATLRPSDVL